MRKVKTNHPFSKKQLLKLNEELKKISGVQVVALRGASSIPGKNNDYTDIRVLHSPFMLDVFLSYMDLSLPDRPRSYMIKIDTAGNVDREVRGNMAFNSLADRVTFFNSLVPVELNY